MKTLKFLSLLFVLALCCSEKAFALGEKVEWDRHSLILDGKRVVPVMGEIHFSRIPANEWAREVKKMKIGGCTIIATYIFWNMHEEEEGVFDWSGQRDLRTFINICKAEGLPVVLRVGPFCHGEDRNGGIPDWMFQKGCKMRSEQPEFLACVERLYRQIFSQIVGLQWKDGGPIIACQFDNEYRGRASYLLKLKEIAKNIGFDLPFYTRTGWPELATPVPFGELLPLYGDYADGFWERSIAETAGNYYKAFNFKAFRSSTAIASEQLGKQEEKINKGDEDYPYFTCELGGGMATAYHRRPFVYADDALSMAVVKLGSGSNLLGYYMYHGGTNPDSRIHTSYFKTQNLSYDGVGTFNENQRTQATNYNDMPVKNYDFQAPLGEFGQIGDQFYPLRKLHLFMQDMAETLAPMEATFPSPQDLKKGDDSQLRWAYRSLGDSGFVFINNYERLQNISDKKNVRFEICGKNNRLENGNSFENGEQNAGKSFSFPAKPITIPAGTIAIMPFNLCGMKYATAQIVACRDGKVFLQPIKGIKTEIALKNGKTLKNLKPLGLEKPVAENIYLLTSEQADTLFLQADNAELESVGLSAEALTPLSKLQPKAELEAIKLKEAGAPRKISIGAQKVAEEPTDENFQGAAVYEIPLSNLLSEHSVPDLSSAEERPVPGLSMAGLMAINYAGDCARLYADGRLIADHFNYGRPFLFGLWRLPEGVKKLELRILPQTPDMPIYFPKETDRSSAEQVKQIVVY